MEEANKLAVAARIPISKASRKVSVGKANGLKRDVEEEKRRLRKKLVHPGWGGGALPMRRSGRKTLF